MTQHAEAFVTLLTCEHIGVKEVAARGQYPEHLHVERADVGIAVRRLDICNNVETRICKWQLFRVAFTKCDSGILVNPLAEVNRIGRQINSHHRRGLEKLANDPEGSSTPATDIQETAICENTI